MHGIEDRKHEMPFEELVKLYLSKDHDWSPNTLDLKRYVLNAHIKKKQLPSNITSKAIHIRTINSCWNWGLKKGHITKAKKLEGNSKGEARTRVFNSGELKLLFSNLEDKKFTFFIKFAYYTGARSGEIRKMQKNQINNGLIEVIGKTGKRFIKINSQAQRVIKEVNPLWSYSKDYVSHRFKKIVRKLNIPNARFHDLRRTFGLNLIKGGMDIYRVSKLLGHKSVKTTENHYAPLLTNDIEDFKI